MCFRGDRVCLYSGNQYFSAEKDEELLFFVQAAIKGVCGSQAFTGDYVE